MPNLTPQEVFRMHVAALAAGDIDGILALRDETSVLITGDRIYRGKAQIGAFYRKLMVELPKASWQLGAEIYENNILYIEWSATSICHNVTDGVDTFVFDAGIIVVQTARCSLVMTRLNA